MGQEKTNLDNNIIFNNAGSFCGPPFTNGLYENGIVSGDDEAESALVAMDHDDPRLRIGTDVGTARRRIRRPTVPLITSASSSWWWWWPVRLVQPSILASNWSISTFFLFNFNCIHQYLFNWLVVIQWLSNNSFISHQVNPFPSFFSSIPTLFININSFERFFFFSMLTETFK